MLDDCSNRITDTVGAGIVGEELLRTIQDHKLCSTQCWLCLDLEEKLIEREPPEKEIVYEEELGLHVRRRKETRNDGNGHTPRRFL